MLVFFVALLLPSVLALEIPAYKRESAGAAISIPLTKRYNAKGQNIPEADRARANAIIESGKPKSRPTSLTNLAVTYIISVGVGAPPTEYELVVDTGSSNTWVGANQNYIPTATSFNTSVEVNVTYGVGFFRGTEFFDILTLGPGFSFNQSIGVAQVASDSFAGQDGIFGIGPNDLTNHTLNGTNEIIPTVVDTMHAQGLIPSNLFSVSLKPTFGNDTPPEETGVLDFGGIDTTKAAGPVTFVPITTTTPSSRFWGVNSTITMSGRQKPLISNSAGIVDTGTTLVSLATEAFQEYQEAIGASLDNSTGLLKVTKEQFQKLPSLNFNMGEVKLELTRDAQAWPQGLNEFIGGEPNSIYLIVSDIGSPKGKGMDFILAETALQRFMAVFDKDNKRIGFSTTPYTFSIVNVLGV